jgi:pimeloyl-ACP methyl ester carboxylesterase
LSDQQLAEVAQTLPKGATRPTVHNHGQTPQTVEADCLWRLSSSAPVEASTLDGVVGRGRLWVVADSETAPQTGYAPVNGLQMYYELHGSGGIPLLLLHGGLFNIDLQFGQLMPGLAATRKVIAADFQGHGRTGDIDRPLTSAGLASDVVDLLGHLDIAQADVFGFSVGGVVALHLAINHPELVRKLIVSSASFDLDGGRQENKEAMEALTVDAVAGTPMEQDYRAKSPNPDKLQELLDKLGRFDAGFTGWAEANIRGIAAPTLLTVGDCDAVRLEHMVRFLQLRGGDVNGDFVGVPASQLAVFPGTTHFFGLAKTELVLGAVLPFLDAAPT